MRFVWVIRFTCSFVALLHLQGYAAAENQKLNGWFKSCQEKTGASDEDYELIKMRKIPSTKAGTCMVECLFSKFHIIENGRFNKRGFVITFSPVLRGDFRKLSQLKEIAAICDEEITNDVQEDCHITTKVLECFAKNKDKLDLAKKS